MNMVMVINTKIIAHSAKMQELLRTADLVAGTDVPVMITGETGTGKAFFSQRIHQQSQRSQRPLVTVNCASLTEEYAESILFGYKKGAFTGADENSAGLIHQARSSSLFFDEIAELPLSIQAKLLHFIESGEAQPLGYTSPKKYDVRIIVASQKDLSKEVEAGRFRADLYYRLNVIPIELPVLAERESDVQLLIEHFFQSFVREKHLASPTFTKAALRQISGYNWPGNIRELRNFCERMFVLFSGKEIDVSNLPQEIRLLVGSTNSSNQPFSLPASGINLEEVEMDLLNQALSSASGNKSRAARLLGLTRDTFLYRLKKYSI